MQKFCCRWEVENCSKEKKATWTSQMMRNTPHLRLLPYACRYLCLLTEGIYTVGWGQVKGHLQGLVLIETISPHLDRQLFMALRFSTTMSAGGWADAHVAIGPTGYEKCAMWRAEVDVNDKKCVLNMPKVTIQDTPPFGVGACLPHSKLRNVTFTVQFGKASLRSSQIKCNSMTPPSCNCSFVNCSEAEWWSCDMHQLFISEKWQE
jgi:hypothetical protein